VHTIHSNEQKMIGCCHVCSIFVVFASARCASWLRLIPWAVQRKVSVQ
jgi:hypothetical protein